MGFLNKLLKIDEKPEEHIEKKQEVVKKAKETPAEVKPKVVKKVVKQPICCADNIKKELDEQQLAAVEAPFGNTCVFAIAGSGKTRTLTYRVANLIDNGVPESEIMLLTFTNKAADEMTERICKVLGKKKLNLTSGTFHSVASGLLRKYAKEIDISPKFKIATPGIQFAFIEKCRLEYLENYMSGFNNDEFPSVNVIADIYSGAINHNKTFRDYMKEFYSYYRNETPDGIILILKDYVKRKEKENMLDFDDLLLNFMDLLSVDKVRKEINQSFKYIFVDEYQDINWMQYEILEKLNTNNMFVIGDAKQCIYQFRGSRPEYIDRFKNTHEDVASYSLTYNYRSTPEILKFAEEAIFYNDPQNRVIMETKNPKGSMPFIFGHDDEIKEVEKIAEIIKENHMDLEETAILVRRGAQVNMVERIIRKAKIPCNIVGSVSMYDMEHIQDLIAFLQLIDDKTNEAAFARVAGIFRGVGAKTSAEIYDRLKDANFDYLTTAKRLKGTQQNVVNTLAKIVLNDYSDISSMLQYVINIFYGNYAKNRFPDFPERMEDIRYFFRLTSEYDDLTNFLDDVATKKKQERKQDRKCLTIITMHKAKGLEWDNVFIPFVDKNEWPRCRDKEYLFNNENIKNERNLFYVAVTRAKKHLYISYSLFYTEKPAGASLFLEEIDEDAYDADFYGKVEEEEE